MKKKVENALLCNLSIKMKLARRELMRGNFISNILHFRVFIGLTLAGGLGLRRLAKKSN